MKEISPKEVFSDTRGIWWEKKKEKAKEKEKQSELVLRG